MLARYSDLQDRFRFGDGYSIELKTATVLQGLGFAAADFERRTETFSGGWQMRIALAKLLLGQPNLLLLDEPTNHLDLEARNWLETYLIAYPHAVILVSHDRFFLDAVVTRIADLTLRTLTDYHTNYSGYLLEHHERDRGAAEGEARTGRGSRARQDVHRPVPLPGDESLAGPEPDQDARKSGADRGAARAQEDHVQLSDLRQERTHRPRADARAQGVRRPRGLRRSQPAHRARRSHRARRPQRRGQVDADADALRRRSAGRRRARRRAPRRDAVLRAGRSDAHGSGADRVRNAGLRLAERHGAGDPQHPRRFSVLRRRCVQAR